MAMEYRQTIFDAHSKNILAIAYNVFRREIYTAGEDSVIKVWEAETGKLLNTLIGHVGWVTSLIYFKEMKTLISCSIDGFLIAWGVSGKIIQKIQTGNPIYSMAYNSRHHQIMLGHVEKVRLFQLILPEDSHGSTDVFERKSVLCSEHDDVVSCIISCEGRFYSAGFDKKLVIYDVHHHGDSKIKVVATLQNAHDAAISCMIFAKDADNSWIVTGSFDRIVKLWSLDGNLLQRFDGFMDTITSITYVVPTQTLWITANSQSAIVYDPRSGINVSDFINTETNLQRGKGGFQLKVLVYFHESNEIVATSNRKSITTWRFNPVAPCTILTGNSDIVESLCFTSQEPILIFSGGDDGIIKKWERMQLNTFMYSQDTLALPREEKIIEMHHQSHDKIKKKLNSILNKKSKHKKHHHLDSNDLKTKLIKTTSKGVSALHYCETLDVLISGYEDSRICIWGYIEESNDLIVENFEIEGNDHVSNRVSGLSLKNTFTDHKDVVTCLTSITEGDNCWLISSGWDRRICLWDLKTQKLLSVFSNDSGIHGKEELAADGIILDIEYCADRKEFGYASADKQAYIRKFSTKGTEMTLHAVLQGHEAEVTQIKWHKRNQIWITGSEDRTIRLWPAQGIPAIRIINNEGSVTSLSIDLINGCVLTGSQDKCIRVFDLDRKDEVVQKNQGHTDEIRKIIHIPSRNQYVSASWDNSVRIWNAYLKKGQRKVVVNGGAFDDINEIVPTFADLNPLILPKNMPKIITIKEDKKEKALNAAEENAIEQNRLEEDLKSTLIDFEIAMDSPDKLAAKKLAALKK